MQARRLSRTFIAMFLAAVMIAFTGTGSANADIVANNIINAPSGRDVSVSVVSQDGDFIYVADRTHSKFLVYDTASEAWLPEVSLPLQPASIAVSPRGSQVVIGAMDGIMVIEMPSQAVHVISLAGTLFEYLTIDSAGKYAYVVDAGFASVQVVDVQSFRLLQEIGLPANFNPRQVAVSPDGGKLYVVENLTDSLSVINLKTHLQIATVNVGSSPVAMAVSPDGMRIYVANGTANSLSVIDAQTLQTVETVATGNRPIGVVVSPDSSHYFVTCLWSETFDVYSADSNELVQNYALPQSSGPITPSITRDGATVVIALQYESAVNVFTLDPALPAPQPTGAGAELSNTGINREPWLIIGAVLLLIGIGAMLLVRGRAT